MDSSTKPMPGLTLIRLLMALPLVLSAPHVSGLAATTTDDRLLLEVAAEPTTPYVEARLVYRLSVLARVPMRQATLSAPTTANATVRRIGDDRRWRETRDGVDYSVLERRWAIIPQQAGPLRIAGPRLAAAVPVMADDRSPADDTALIERLETLHLTAGELVLEVQAPPAAADAPWLPAESVSISEQWDPRGPEAHVGIPLTRTIQIEAAGVTAAQLSAPALSPVAGFKVYADQPARDERLSGDDLWASLTQRITYVPTAAGDLQLPALRVPWWNLGLDAPATAMLPARDRTVVGAAVDTPPASIAARPGAEHPAQSGPDADSTRQALLAAAAGCRCGAWLAGLLAMGWLVTALRCRRRQTRAGQTAPTAGKAPDWSPNPAPLAGALLRLEHACRDHDAAAARAALLDWGARRWPTNPPRGLDELGMRLGTDARARAATRAIDARLYGADRDPDGGADGDGGRRDWQPAATLRAIKPWLVARSFDDTAAPPALPALYPRQSPELAGK